MGRPAPAEEAALRVMLWATTGAAAALPVLVLPAPEDPLLPATAHLSVVVLFSVALTFHLAGLLDGEWFAGHDLPAAARRALGGVWLVVLVTGAAGLVALATAAAYRFDPSLQFLQVISALGVAWVEAALILGLRRRLGGGAAATGAAATAAVCIWSMWRYLDVVGFTPAGGWLVDGGEFARLVLPFGAAAGMIAATAFVIGMRAGGDPSGGAAPL